MHVKTLKLVRGIPAASTTVAAGTQDSGAQQVTLTISAIDAFAIPEVVSNLRMSTSEAADLANRILRAVASFN